MLLILQNVAERIMGRRISSIYYIQHLLSACILPKSVCSLLHTPFNRDFIIAARMFIGSTCFNRKRANINNAGRIQRLQEIKRSLFFALQQK